LSLNRPAVAIAVEGLEKSYREWPVLWNLDLTVPWGETLALFGANGAGKTTLLRILSTSVRPDAGTVLIAGRDMLRQTAEVRRRIGVVGHRSFLYDDLTPLENLNYYARLYDIKDREARVNAALDRVGLSGRANHRVRTLSNGMQKRAAIARAILHQPDVLLLDEPEAGLDRDSRLMLGNLLSEWTEEGRSAVLTTHDIDLGLAWGHRAAVLTGGSLAFPDGGAEEIQRALSLSGSERNSP
jgi:heme exporter protein A